MDLFHKFKPFKKKRRALKIDIVSTVDFKNANETTTPLVVKWVRERGEVRVSELEMGFVFKFILTWELLNRKLSVKIIMV